MSDTAARAALERMNLREVAVAASYSTLASDLRQMAATEPEEAQKKFMEHRRTELCAAYGFEESPQRKPFAFSSGVAIIPVSGSLINRFGQSYGFVTGYNFIRRQMTMALADEDVKGIVLDVNSYGGEAAGCFELSADIRKMRGTKPIIAVIDSNCYSAGYAVASAADKIVCTPSGGAGSIGVVAMHVDMSKMLKDYGVEVTFIHFGEHKVDGNPYEKLSPEVKKDIQKGVDKSGEMFVALVATNRNIDAAKVKATEARVYRAEEAQELGLIDTIATPSEAMQVFFGELTGSNQQLKKEDAMSASTEATPGATNAAQATQQATQAAPDTAALEKAASDARVAERARVAGITGCDEAKGRSTLANHLAMNTDMPVEAAKAVLAASPAEAAAAAPAATANPFKQAMDAGTHPNVGASASDGTELTAAQKILQAQAGYTGVKHDAK